MAFFQNMYYTCSCPDERAKKCDRECHRFRLMTHTESNADRIRAMSDEELADWIFDRAKCQNCKELPCVKHDKGTDCRELWLDWLKQEVDDDTR